MGLRRLGLQRSEIGRLGRLRLLADISVVFNVRENGPIQPERWTQANFFENAGYALVC